MRLSSGRSEPSLALVNPCPQSAWYIFDMEMWSAAPYKDYKWIVSDAALLGGKLVIRDTRFSVSFILGCLADGMSVADIEEEYGRFPHEAIPEMMRIDPALLDFPPFIAGDR